jgi:hypothetical protein
MSITVFDDTAVADLTGIAFRPELKKLEMPKRR